VLATLPTEETTMIPLTNVSAKPKLLKWKTDAQLEAEEARRARRLAANAARRAENEAFDKTLYYRFQVIKSRGEAHGLQIGNYLGPTLLAFSPLASWLGKNQEPAILMHYLHVLPERYVAAALANPMIKTPAEELRKNAPIRLRFEQASVYGTIGECMSAARSKSWGSLVSVDPIEPNMPYDGTRIQYFFHPESRYNRRVEQRKWMKNRLGKRRPLVTAAMGATQKDFLKTINADAARRIDRAFGIDPIVFWRAAKGLTTLTRPPTITQGELFL